MEMKRSYQLFLLIMINYSSLVLLRYLSVGHIDKTFFHQLSFDLSKPKALVKLRNIVAETLFFLFNVSLFAHLGKHWCGNKINICFPGSKNVSQQIQEHFLLRKQCFLIYPHVFKCFQQRNIVFSIGHVQTMFKDYTANINNTLRFVRANVSQKCFLVCPHWETWQNIDGKQCFCNNVS